DVLQSDKLLVGILLGNKRQYAAVAQEASPTAAELKLSDRCQIANSNEWQIESQFVEFIAWNARLGQKAKDQPIQCLVLLLSLIQVAQRSPTPVKLHLLFTPRRKGWEQSA